MKCICMEDECGWKKNKKRYVHPCVTASAACCSPASSAAEEEEDDDDVEEEDDEEEDEGGEGMDGFVATGAGSC